MKKLVVLLAMSGVALACAAQDAEGAAAASARIKADRAQVESIYRADEKACYGKFAVNDCLNDARARRRSALADLRRQEVSLGDAERRRRAADRLREIDERAAANKAPPRGEQPGQQPGAAPPQRKSREVRASDKRAEQAHARQARAAQAQSRQQRAQHKQADSSARRAGKAAETRRNLERHQQRLEDAAQRREKLAARLAARKKPAAQPLPVPPQ